MNLEEIELCKRIEFLRWNIYIYDMHLQFKDMHLNFLQCISCLVGLIYAKLITNDNSIYNYV